MPNVDLEKRKRVMGRSMRLGHCICDPKKACPCDLFRERDVCLCAGETREVPSGPVRLTTLVEKAGCASKIDQASLKRILRGLPEIDDPRVLVGSAAGDDAGVYALEGEVALVQTVDVFCPSVDDPYTFGCIAASNSLSDVYAMGGRPLTALSVIGFPVREVDETAMAEILRGGIETMREAGVPVVGGHSIQDPQIKAGFAVTGLVDRKRIFTNAGARPGDALVLTKPLGTGILAFAVQIGRASAAAARAIGASMAALNRTASERMIEHGAHACTDVTGFGLMGHLAEMARASQTDVQIAWDALPVFDEALEALAAGIVPGGIERNRESSEAAAVPGEGVTDAMMDLCFDPQTSGGLLVALPQENAEAYVAALRADGVSAACIIGRVLVQGAGRVHVRTDGSRTMPTPADETREPARDPKEAEACCSDDAAESCCADAAQAMAEEACCSGGAPSQVGRCAPPPAQNKGECCAPPEAGGAPAASAPGAGATENAFRAFMGAAGKPGALDAATKQAVNLALSVLAKCEPCLATHVRKARAMGFSDAEIDDAAWMAIAFGGSPTWMFYKDAMKKIGG